MATHFKGPLIVAESGSVIPGLLANGATATLAVAGAATVGTTLDVTGASTVGTLAIGGGSVVKQVASGVVSVDAGTLAAQTAIDVSVTVTGAAAGDIVAIMPADASMEAGLAVQAVWISGASTVKIRLFNNNAVVALTGGAQNWTYLWTDLT